MSGERAAVPAAFAPVAAQTASTNGQKLSANTKEAVVSAWITRVAA